MAALHRAASATGSGDGTYGTVRIPAADFAPSDLKRFRVPGIEKHPNPEKNPHGCKNSNRDD